MAVLRRVKALAVIVITLLGAHWLTPAFQCKSPVAAISESNEERRNIGPANGAGDAANRRAANALDNLPLHFEENQGRAAKSSRFIARAAGLDFSITPTEAVMHLRAREKSAAAFRHTPTRIAGVREPEAAPTPPTRRRTASLRMQLVGANRRARLTGENQRTSHTNYFIGNDPRQWRGDVPNYARVKVQQVYRGVDVVYYGSGKLLEYDFNVAPGAAYKAIRLRFRGAKGMAIDESGDLVIDTPGGQIRQHKPVAYQLVAGERREIAARYILRREREIGFHIGTYDRSRPLIIDPALSYSTFFGGESNDSINAVAVDARGNAYVAGATDSSDLAITPSAFQSRGGIRSVLTVGFVAKFDLTNNRLVYSTYIGGSPGPTGGFASSSCLAVAIDSAGNAYITGWTGAANFPITPNAFQRVLAGGTDAFIAKLNTTGSALVYSTYLGSSKGPVSGLSPLDEGLGIAVDAAGSAYVTGRTIGMDFPVTAGALKTAHDRDTGLAGSIDPVLLSFTDAFVTKLNPTGTALVYSTYLGGGGDDTGSGIKVDAAGNAYVVGATRAGNFPTSNPTQANLGGGSDAFIAKLNQDGSALVYSTYVGGTSDDTGKAVAIDESGNVYVSGTTASTDLPVTAGAFQPASADVSIYKSTNGGASWALSNVGLPGNSSISLISIDPVNPSSLYASVFGRVFNSTDSGRRWKNTVGESPSGVPTRVLAFDPRKPSTVYGVMDRGFFPPQLLRSFNGGQTWEAINAFFPTTLPIRMILDLAVDPVNTTTIYVITEQGLFKTTDGGTWIGRGKGLPNNGAFAAILAIDPKNPDRLFASASGELFTSTNGGKKWGANSLSGATIFSVTFDPVTASTVYASGAGLFKSTDGGQSWQEVDNDLPTFGVGKLVIDPSNPLVLYTTTRGGVFKSTDGGRHWMAINAGLGPHFLGFNSSDVSLSIDPRNPSTLYARGPAAGSDAFVGKLNQSGSAFAYLSYLGGTGIDSATSLVVDGEGNAYLTGQTGSIDFPVSRAFQPDKSFPDADLFVTKLRPDGAGLAYSTYLGGALQDYGNGIDVDRFGSAYVVGYSLSPDFPLANNLQSSFRVTEGILAQIVDTVSSQPAPTISDVGPSSGSSGGQYPITILGANFLPGARVRIGGAPVTITEVTSNSIRGVVNGRPASMIEPVDVVVSNLDGQSTVLKNGFTFLPLPRISGISIKGKELAVFGDGFDKGAVILVEGSPQKTRLDVSGSIDGVILLSKKAAKKIASGQTVIIQVTNVYGLTSAPVSYTRPVN